MLTTIDVACLPANLEDKGLSSSANILQIAGVRPSSCILAVLAMFLANSSPNSFFRNE